MQPVRLVPSKRMAAADAHCDVAAEQVSRLMVRAYLAMMGHEVLNGSAWPGCHLYLYTPMVGILTIMNENTFWILTALAGERRHGYAILRDVQALTASKVSLRVTTLYASLERLEREGQVRRAGEEIVDGRARRYYELTDAGVQALTLETERLSVRLAAAEQRLAVHRPAPSPTAPSPTAPGRSAPATMAWGFAG